MKLDLQITNLGVDVYPNKSTESLFYELIIGNVVKGDKGDSAYKVWLDNGHTGTEQDFFDWIQQPATDAAAELFNLVGIYNVTALQPLGSGYYTLATSLAAVPSDVRKVGLFITFESSANNWMLYQFKGSSTATWTTQSNWVASVFQSTGQSTLYAMSQKATTDALGSKLDKSSVKQVTGASTTDVMSQKATTDIVNSVSSRVSVLESNQAVFWYGVEWNTTVGDPQIIRIGNPYYHTSLPIQSMMRRCLLKDNGEVNYYLHPSNSLYKENGDDSILDGADGMVEVEIPEFYIRFETEGIIRRCKMSPFALAGFTKVPKMYRSAYEATVDRTTATLKLASVVNTTAAFRGGNNNADWDGTYRSLLGRPASFISLTNFRAYARNRGVAGLNGAGWNCDVYEAQKICYWLYLVEYANFNSQATYNAALNANGYRQGGLGAGVTTLSPAGSTAFNNGYGFIPCGYTNSLGNGSGIVNFSMPAEYGSSPVVNVPSYRGIENPFGHLWSWTDGCKCNIQSIGSGGLSEFYVCKDPSKYQDVNYSGYLLSGLLSRDYSYIKEFILGDDGENMPKTCGGSSTTYMCDNLYGFTPGSGVIQRGVLFGGDAAYGAVAGLSYSYTANAASFTYASFGSRLCFIPE